MDTNDIKDQVKAAVTLIFAEKEEADRQSKTEDALNKSAATIDNLTKALESKNTEVSELEGKLEDSASTITKKDEEVENLTSEMATLKDDISKKDIEISTLKEEMEKVVKEKEEVATELATAKATIEEATKAKIAEDRYANLEEAKVASKDKDNQLAKLKEMSDEAFESYKAELVSFRETIVASVSKTKATGTENASLNIESDTNISTQDKYAALGQAMASLITEKKEVK